MPNVYIRLAGEWDVEPVVAMAMGTGEMYHGEIIEMLIEKIYHRVEEMGNYSI